MSMFFMTFFQKKARRTLFNRLVRIISLLTFSIVMLFTAATLLITYSFETVLFNERLQQAHAIIKNGGSLPYEFTHYDLAQSKTLDDEKQGLKQSLLAHVARQEKDYGKFQFEQSEYHYLLTNNGLIVYDTTNVTIIDRALEDVFLILAILLFPVAILTYWIAKVAARYALKPFSKLTQLFTQSQKHDAFESNLLQDIEEQDVKSIAIELQSALQLKAHALQQKREILEQQVTFNRGMAHELRTPLQVMRHSVELLGECHPVLVESAAFRRLDSAMHRTIRLTNGLLWLTSEQAFTDKIDVQETVQNSILSLKDLSEIHSIVIDLEVKDNFRLGMPAVVLDLILFNLFNNVVTHASPVLASEPEIQTKWTVVIDKNQITCGNAIIESAHEQAANHNFGIGLELVSRLAQRFGCNSTHKIQNGNFIARLSVD